MKKVLKLTALFIIAAALFTACKKDSDEDGFDDGILFSKNDVSINVDITENIFSDGDWVSTFRKTDSAEYNGNSMEISEIERTEFTVSENGENVVVTRDVTTYYQKATINGQTRISCETKETDAEQLKVMGLYSVRNNFWRVEALKTNEEHTKFYGEVNNGIIYAFYAMKK